MTDRVKKDFEKWLITEDSDFYLAGIFPENFGDLSPSMQFGVWVDYYASCKICVQAVPVEWYDETPYYYAYNVFKRGKYPLTSETGCGSLEEARKAALEKASEIREEQLKKQ